MKSNTEIYEEILSNLLQRVVETIEGKKIIFVVGHSKVGKTTYIDSLETDAAKIPELGKIFKGSEMPIDYYFSFFEFMIPLLELLAIASCKEKEIILDGSLIQDLAWLNHRKRGRKVYEIAYLQRIYLSLFQALKKAKIEVHFLHRNETGDRDFERTLEEILKETGFKIVHIVK